MKTEDLIYSLRCGFFASRESINEAYEYALDVLGRNAQTLTAVHVLMNAIADQIEMQNWVDSYEMPKKMSHIDYQMENDNEV